MHHLQEMDPLRGRPRVPATRLERQIQLAREVQAELLPRRPHALATLEYAGVTIPADGVGGDCFDFIRPSPRRVALCLSDVSGKGVPAALMSASLQASLRSHYALGAGDLRTRLESVHRLFHECTGVGNFASLFLGEYDDRTGALRYANCGHPSPVLLRADGSVEWLAATAPLLGVLDTWTCDLGATRLRAGDLLLVYSDGATEAMNVAGEQYGEARLAMALGNARGLALPEILRRLTGELRAFGGGPLADDLTMVVGRARIPAPAERRVLATGNGSTPGRPGGCDADPRPSR